MSRTNILIAVYALIQNLFFLWPSSSVAQGSQVLQTLEEINAELRVKKQNLEPFDSSKVKIDVESLGLDDVEKIPSEKSETIAVQPSRKKSDKNWEDPESREIDLAKPEEIKAEVRKTEAVVNSSEVKTLQESNIQAVEPKIENESAVKKNISKVKSLSGSKPDKKTSKEEVTKESINELKKTGKSDYKKKSSPKKTSKKRTENYINSPGKQKLRKRLESERQKFYVKKKEEKLNEAREEYLIKFDPNSYSDEKPSIFETGDDRILPQEKNLSPFLVEEEPPLPIMSRMRSRDNLHIPLVPTPEEQIETLFSSVKSGIVSYFNGAFNEVRNPNVMNRDGQTLLTYALMMQKYAIVASILGKGADPNMPNKLGWMPLDIAIELLDIRSIKLLIDNKVDVNYTDAFDRTYLMHAARLGFLPAVQMLVDKGVDLNALDSEGFTALSIAYRHKKEFIVKYLLLHDAKTWVERPFNPGRKSMVDELESRWKQ